MWNLLNHSSEYLLMKTRQSLSCKFHNYRNEKYTSVQVCPTFLPHIYFTRHIFLRRVTARWSRGLAQIKCGPVKSRKFVISNCMYQKLRDPSKIVIIKSENSSVNWLKSLWASFTWKPSLDWKNVQPVHLRKIKRKQKRKSRRSSYYSY